ncbi:MAG: hypothetical protein IEMM0006_1843 [bacterium]|nr:MAG: hypothetical protein IEMM0006_1843 [bacterium]
MIRFRYIYLVIGVALTLAACQNNKGRSSTSGGSSKEQAIVTIQSQNNFFTTTNKLQSAVAAQNLVLLKQYDIQAMMKMVGMNIGPFTTFQLFHPRYGKPIINNDPDAFVSTPLDIAVRESNGKITVFYRKPSDVYHIFNLPSSLTSKLDNDFAKIAKAATSK